jgi:hypothetical protein
MADWQNEGSPHDLLTSSWSPLYTGSYGGQPSGSHDPFSIEDSSRNQPVTGDHSIMAIPQHHATLGDDDDNTGDHLTWTVPSPAPDSHNFPLNITTSTRGHAGSPMPQHNLLRRHDAPMSLFGMAASPGHSGNHQLQLPLSNPASSSIDIKIVGGFRRARPEHADYVQNASIHPSNPMIPNSPSLSVLAGTQLHTLSPQLVAEVKEDARFIMIRLMFDTSFFPMDDVLDRMADDALSIAVAKQQNGDYILHLCLVVIHENQRNSTSGRYTQMAWKCCRV